MSDRGSMRSINPATEEVLATFDLATAEEVEAAVSRARDAFTHWRETSFPERARLMRAAAALLRQRKTALGTLATLEMGKPIAEAEAEVEKCAWVCEYYAEEAAGFLADDPRATDASESYVEFLPLGTILAVMPWNFPFWQLMRFAAPALMAGNTAILKHASNVPQCALAAAELFRDAGFPAGVFQSLLLSGEQATRLLEDPRIAAVTLTGSELAGASIGEAAGRAIKKAVLELGGSDPFIVLADASLRDAVAMAVRSRFQNAGQSCIAAKRFIVVESVFDAFERGFVDAVGKLRVGDPLQRDTQVGPLARDDLRDGLEEQLRRSVEAGARVATGGERVVGRGYFFQPTVVTGVRRDMPLFREETFGPVAALIRTRDADEAVALANDSPYGLGCNLWTADIERARSLARRIESGLVFVNGMVASDPRLPFGGVKRSGHGRELAEFGIREFVNIQSVWIGPKRA